MTEVRLDKNAQSDWRLTKARMDQRAVSEQVERKISDLFEELRSGISEREDSRAFGAMVEKRIADNWQVLCSDLGYSPLDRPGRRTIFDFAFLKEDRIVGITGKVRLNYTLNQIWDEIAWDRRLVEFYGLFVDLAITHYRRVSRDAGNRIKALERFRQDGYRNFSFTKI